MSGVVYTVLVTQIGQIRIDRKGNKIGLLLGWSYYIYKSQYTDTNKIVVFASIMKKKRWKIK